MVARVALSNMRQGHEEPIRSFYARIKGRADTCKYEMKCTNAECNRINDFTEKIIRNVIARGIADQEIQLDLLGEKNQDMTLKDMIEYIVAKESGKRSASRLLDPQSTDAISSSYREGNNRTYATREEPGWINRNPSPKRYASTAASWVTVRHPRGIPDVPNAPRMVKSARNVAARITSTRRV